MQHLVTLGAKTSLEDLQRTVREACAEVLISPLPDCELTRAFPTTYNVVSLELPPPNLVDAPAATHSRLVTHRRTPSGALRRIVVGATVKFGAVQLLVRSPEKSFEDTSANRLQRAITTLSGFLRSGRVVQENTLLRIQIQTP